jgi:predicted MPP superfamily phosphohydrolase
MWFHPKKGWLRRAERAASHWLTREVYHRIPGIHLPYDYVLRSQLTLSDAEVVCAGLAPAFDGLRILFLSDLHAGPLVSPAALHEALRRVQSVEPDVILLGGDLITTRTEEFESHRRAFESLRAPLGVYAVLGNHDHYSCQPERVRALAEDAGIVVLHNRSVRLRRRGACLDLAGVDDMLMGRPDLPRALERVEAPVILLSHNPDLFFDAVRHNVALMLAGHTHGGQIRVPGFPVLVRQSRYRLDQGRYHVGESELIVSRGLGAVGLPWRAQCPPEAVLIRLRGRASPGRETSGVS